MSMTKWIWVVVAVVVVVVGLWWAGVFSGTKPSHQAAAVVTSQPQTDPALGSPAIKSDVAKIDTQVAVAVAPLSAAPTKAQISATVSAINSASTMMRALANKFSAIGVNAKTMGSAVPNVQALADLSIQLSNAGSQAGAANSTAMATSSSAASLKTAAGYIQTAQTAIKAARADVQTILNGLGIK